MGRERDYGADCIRDHQLSLHNFPNLESFELCYDYNNLSMERNDNDNQRVIRFFDYLLLAKPAKLQFVQLTHQNEVKRRLDPPRYHVNSIYVDEDTSLQICKLIIALTNCKEMNIKTIELSPVILRKSEVDYLDFWFGDGHQFGCVEKTIYSQK